MMVVVDVMVVRLCDYDHRSKQIGGDGVCGLWMPSWII
ncbi:hypothetical protein NC651_031426 [Populus alba x Populus x berolinensis]|nr:hypothetical protein NC651_031426 [Populus alba x Populus x berolinensis]